VIILRGRWCGLIVLNLHTPSEDKSDDIKDSFYEEVGLVFDQFIRYDIKIFGGDFDVKVGREYIFKLTIRNKFSHNVINDNRVRVVNFAYLRT
jgi:hypothetical protein